MSNRLRGASSLSIVYRTRVRRTWQQQQTTLRIKPDEGKTIERLQNVIAFNSNRHLLISIPVTGEMWTAIFASAVATCRNGAGINWCLQDNDRAISCVYDWLCINRRWYAPPFVDQR